MGKEVNESERKPSTITFLVSTAALLFRLSNVVLL